jgi:Bacterial SH3 domain
MKPFWLTSLALITAVTPIVTAAIVTAPISIVLTQRSATAGTASCFKIQDSDGWANLRRTSNSSIVGKLYNGTTFVSAYTTDDSRILGGLGNNSLKVAISRTRLVDMSACDNRYWTVSDRDGFANLRSTPGGTVSGRIDTGTSVMILDKSGEWTRILTPDNRLGYIHSSRLYRD